MLRKFVWFALMPLLLAVCAPAAEETASPTPAPAATAIPQPVTGVPTPATTATPIVKPTLSPSRASEAKPKYGGVIRLIFRTDETRTEIHLATGARELRKGSSLAMQKPLSIPVAPTGKDCVFEPVGPNLAQEWGWVSDTEFRLKLRQGIRFHPKPPVNGRELTAQDLAYSYQRYFREQDRALFPDTKVEALDRYTVVFRTPAPRASFAPLLFAQDNYGNLVVAPEAVGPKLGNLKSREQWVGTGPFMFEQDVPGTKWVYKKHPNYFKEGLPYLEGVEFIVMPEMSTRVAAVLAGKLDMGEPFTTLEASAIKRTRPDLDYRSCDNQAVDVVYMRADQPPFNDVRVRRAMSMAIDRQAIASSIMAGDASVIAFVSPVFRGALEIKDHPPELRRYLEYNPAEARRLLAEAGYPSGFSTELTYTTKFGRIHNQVMESVATFLSSVGIKTTLVPQALAEYAGSTQIGNYPGLGGFSHNMSSLPTIVSNPLPGVTLGMHAPEDQKLTALSEEILRTVDEAKSQQLFKEFQLLHADRMYYLLAPVGREIAVGQPYVKNWTFKQQYKDIDILLEQVWLDR